MLAENVAAMSGLLKSISHPLRLKILCLLQSGELTVGNIRTAVQTTDANISQHLTIMRNQGIIKTRKDANFIYNRIADKRVVTLINTLENLFCRSHERG